MQQEAVLLDDRQIGAVVMVLPRADLRDLDHDLRLALPILPPWNWRAGLLVSKSACPPARVFVFRGARMASKGVRPRPVAGAQLVASLTALDGLRMKPGGGLKALMCAPPGTPLHTEAAADEPPMR